MGAGSYPFQKLFSRSHFAPKLGMPFVAELQQGKLSSAVLSFSTVEVCSSDLTHMHVIVTKKIDIMLTTRLLFCLHVSIEVLRS